MLRTLLGFSLLFTLFGCSEYMESQPYVTGTFVGFYLTDPQATPVGVRIQTKVVDKNATRYTVAGTAIMGNETYTVEGYEEANPNLNYLSAQALAPSGSLIMNFTDANGTFAYALCADVRYDEAYIDTPLLFEKACGPGNYSESFAEVNLEKLPN